MRFFLALKKKNNTKLASNMDQVTFNKTDVLLHGPYHMMLASCALVYEAGGGINHTFLLNITHSHL